MSTSLNPDVRVRAAGIPDIPEVARLSGIIWNRCYADILSRQQIDYMLVLMYSPETIRSEMDNGISYCLVSDGGRAVGYLSFGKIRHHGQDAMKLHKIYLLPEKQGRSIGSESLKYVVGKTSEAKLSVLMLCVNKNNAAAIRFYERNGFRIADSIVSDIGSGFVMDDFVMERNII